MTSTRRRHWRRRRCEKRGGCVDEEESEGHGRREGGGVAGAMGVRMASGRMSIRTSVWFNSGSALAMHEVWAVWIRWVWAHLVWFKLMFPKSVGLERAEVSEGMVFIRTSCWFYSGAVFPEWAYEGAGG